MEITMDGLVHYLRTDYQIRNNGDISGDFPIKGVSLYTDSVLDKNTVYLCLAGNPVSEKNVLNIVTNEEIPAQPGWFLYCAPGKAFAVVNDCVRAHQDFLQWREKCRELALIEHDLSGLLEHGVRCLRSEMVIIDREYRYDGSAVYSREDPFFSSTSDMDTKDVEDLYVADPRFDETFETDGLVYYRHSPLLDAKLYYYNLRYDRLYLGRILYRIPDAANTPAFLQLVESFSALVGKCYEYHYLQKNKGMPRYSVYDMWKQLLENKPVDQAEVDRKLAAMRWRSDHRYRILYMRSNGYVRSEETMKFYAAQLEQSFPACIAARIGEGIYVLHNLDREADPRFRQNLADFLRENLFVSGISNEFRDFYDSFRYGCQARDALSLGIRNNPSLWRHEFRDYQFQYVQQQCLSIYSARDLCPEGLELLLRHDAENPEVELVKTLEMYYNCKFNAAEAAKRLFIHRTTMFYRLSKIQQIAAIDHDDPDTRLQILLCLAFMREEQRRKQKNRAETMDPQHGDHGA